jgi:hypothetical protein
MPFCCRQALSEQRGMFVVEGGVEVLRLSAVRVQADPVHALTGGAGALGHPVVLQQLDRTGGLSGRPTPLSAACASGCCDPRLRRRMSPVNGAAVAVREASTTTASGQKGGFL